jgi:DNA-binding beta-propeller fold protein YncE
LARSTDGNTVYAAVFHSGNRTTAVNEGVVCDGGASAPPCTVASTTYPGGLPAPNANIPEGITGPETGLIVKFNPGTNHWEDQLGRNWSPAVRFSLPDKDVFAINAAATPPAQTSFFSGVGTIIFNMAVNPVSGKIYVSNTDAHNEVRFEGPGGGGSTVRGHLHEARVTVLSGSTVTPRHLNKHIDYNVVPSPSGIKDNSLATPVGMAVTSDGATLYVAAFGSSEVGVFNTTQLENDTFVPNGANYITVSGGGPSGLVLDEPHTRLYVLTRFDNGIAVVDTSTKTEVDHQLLYNPEPPSVVNGRPFLYDANLTSSNGEASCSSCHVFGDLDSLAWDLGNPDDTVLNNPNPFRVGPIIDPDFHPLKGPMTTQSLRGMANHGPMHWRGDRTGGNDPGGSSLDENAAFNKFNVAFGGLIGRSGPLTTSEMQAFADFILQVRYPPNPIRALDNSLTSDQQAGQNFFLNSFPSDTLERCAGCHVLDRGLGFFGTNGLSSFEGEAQVFKIPHLRNLYQKVGMFGMPAVPFFNNGDNGNKGDQVRGFGFLHDGSTDTLFRFHNAKLFNQSGTNTGGFANNTQRRQVEQFMLAFDSDLFPIVGQQITLTSTNAATAGPRIDLLTARAAAGECDLIVKGTIDGVQRGAYRTAAGMFQLDRNDDAPVSDASVRAFASTPGQELTYTCVPPGSGVRVGVDRDEDGYFDRSEIEGGSNPADPSSPLCASGSLIDEAKLRVSHNASPAGDEKLILKGEWQMTTQTPAIDPIANGFSFAVLDQQGTPIFQRVVTGGASPGSGAPGWKVNGQLTRWTFVDHDGTLAAGVTRVLIRNLSARVPGLFRFKVKGKMDNFQVSSGQVPVQMIATLGGPAQVGAGQCATVAFNPSGGPSPACKLSANEAVLNCH